MLAHRPVVRCAWPDSSLPPPRAARPLRGTAERLAGALALADPAATRLAAAARPAPRRRAPPAAPRQPDGAEPGLPPLDQRPVLDGVSGGRPGVSAMETGSGGPGA